MLTLGDLLKQLGGRMNDGREPHPDYKYHSFYEWAYSEGSPYRSRPLQRAEWQLVDRHLTYREQKQCFANCQQTVLGDYSGIELKAVAEGRLHVLSPFKYVEGYVLSSVGLPIHHAWLSYKGKVLDPTLRVRKPRKRAYFPNHVMGYIPKGWEYYGAVIPWKKITQCVVVNKAWQTVLDDMTQEYPLLQKKAR